MPAMISGHSLRQVCATAVADGRVRGDTRPERVPPFGAARQGVRGASLLSPPVSMLPSRGASLTIGSRGVSHLVCWPIGNGPTDIGTLSCNICKAVSGCCPFPQALMAALYVITLGTRPRRCISRK